MAYDMEWEKKQEVLFAKEDFFKNTKFSVFRILSGD
jgi:hypothetical protein